MHIVELATILFTGSMAAFSRKFSRRLIISIPDRKIALISKDGLVTRVYPVAVGKLISSESRRTSSLASRCCFQTATLKIPEV